MESNTQTQAASVAILYAMERGLNPQGMIRHAEKICSVDLKSIDGVKVFENWRRVWEDIRGEPYEDGDPARNFYNEHMQETHMELVKRLKAKGLLIGRGGR